MLPPLIRSIISYVLKDYWTIRTIVLYNKQNNTWILGNMKFNYRVEQDISLVRFAHS